MGLVGVQCWWEWMRGNVRMDDSGSEGVKVELGAGLEAAPQPIVLHSM